MPPQCSSWGGGRPLWSPPCSLFQRGGGGGVSYSIRLRGPQCQYYIMAKISENNNVRFGWFYPCLELSDCSGGSRGFLLVLKNYPFSFVAL